MKNLPKNGNILIALGINNLRWTSILSSENGKTPSLFMLQKSGSLCQAPLTPGWEEAVISYWQTLVGKVWGAFQSEVYFLDKFSPFSAGNQQDATWLTFQFGNCELNFFPNASSYLVDLNNLQDFLSTGITERSSCLLNWIWRRRLSGRPLPLWLAWWGGGGHCCRRCRWWQLLWWTTDWLRWCNRLTHLNHPGESDRLGLPWSCHDWSWWSYRHTVGRFYYRRGWSVHFRKRRVGWFGTVSFWPIKDTPWCF